MPTTREPAAGGDELIIPVELEEIRRVLNGIGDPCSVANGTPLGLYDMGIVGRLYVGSEGDVAVDLRLTSPSCYMVGYFTEEIQSRVSCLAGVRQVTVSADHGLDWMPSMMTPEAQARRRANLAKRDLLPMVGFAEPT